MVLQCSAVQAGETQAQWLNAQRLAWNIPGVAIATIAPGTAPEVLASGLCNVEANQACAADSQFQIGSITKFFTGLTAATLAADKALRLDEPVALRWPGFRLADARWTEVTLRDLLSGRSGIGAVDWPYFWDPALTRRDYLARLRHQPLVRPFRAGWTYSNANFVAAGSYLEQMTGSSWEDLIRQRLFAPLSMKNSGFAIETDRTRGYAPAEGGSEYAFPRATTQAIGPAGTIVSTAADMARWLEMLVNGGTLGGQQVFPAAAIVNASAPVIGTGYDRRYYGAPGGYGLGVYSATYQGHHILHHGGGYPGYTAHFAWLPQRKLAVVVLANRNATSFAEALSQGLLDRMLGGDGTAIVERWRKAQDAVAPDLQDDVSAPPTRAAQAYAGSYVNPAWGVFEVVETAGTLSIRMGPMQARLAHHRYDSFNFLAERGWERLRVRFDSDFAGNISGLSLDDGTHAQPQLFLKTAKADR